MAFHTARIQRLSFFSLLAAAIVGAGCQARPAGSPSAPGERTSVAAAQTDPLAPGSEGGGEPASPEAARAPASPASDSTSATGSHVFQVKLPAVGTRVLETETDRINLTLSITPSGATSPFKTDRSDRETTEKLVEVLAVSGEAVTKVKVVYRVHSHEKKEDGADKSSPSPIQGKTYLVEVKDGTVRVSLPAGSPAPPEEAKWVAREFSRLGRPDPMQKALPAGPLQVGTRIDAIGDAVKDQLAGADDPGETTTVRESEVTFTGVREEGGARVGVFSVALDVEKTNGHMLMRLAVKGKVEIGLADGMPVAMSFESPVVVAADNTTTGTKIVGAGRASRTSTRKVQ